jgi:hypothetical protein
MIVSPCSPLFILIMYFSFVLYTHAALLVGWFWDWFPVLSLDFSVTYSFWPYHGPGVNSGPNENEYQEHFLGVKAASACGWPHHHLHVWNVMKSGSLNLETSGPVTGLLYCILSLTDGQFPGCYHTKMLQMYLIYLTWAVMMLILGNICCMLFHYRYITMCSHKILPWSELFCYFPNIHEFTHACARAHACRRTHTLWSHN